MVVLNSILESMSTVIDPRPISGSEAGTSVVVIFLYDPGILL